MAAIKIDFPKIGASTSTWVHDDEWIPLSPQQKTALIHRYIKNHHTKQLNQSLSINRRNTPNFTWQEI
jgi:hypothetical protein